MGNGASFEYSIHPETLIETKTGIGKRSTIKEKRTNTDKIRLSANLNSSIANFVHSIDAYLVSKVILKWDRENPHLNIFTIHDAYIVPTSKSEYLTKIVRESLMELFDENILDQWFTKEELCQMQGDLKKQDINMDTLLS